MVNDGDAAPDFTLTADDGRAIQLKTLRGKTVVLYFYPKDDTPGCTQQAKSFSCLIGEFDKAGARVIGVSPEGTKSHQKFKAKHALTFDLLADEDKIAAERYGTWVEKSMYGKKYMGVERSTFLIDKSGKVAKSWRKVKVPGHAEEVLAEVKALKA